MKEYAYYNKAERDREREFWNAAKEDMKSIGWLIETEPQYNALYREMYPVEKIEKEVLMVLEASRKDQLQKDTFDDSLSMEIPISSLHKANKPFPRKRKV